MTPEARKTLDKVRLIPTPELLARIAAEMAGSVGRGLPRPREEIIVVLEATAKRLAELIQDRTDACDMADDLLPLCGFPMIKLAEWRERINQRRAR